MSWTTSC